MPRLDMSRPASETWLPSMASKSALMAALSWVTSYLVIWKGSRPPPWSSFSLSRRIWSSWDRFCSWFFSSAMLSLSYLCGWRGAQRCSTFSSLYSMRPAGASTTTWSPSLLPSRALPKGESSEMAPFMGSAS